MSAGLARVKKNVPKVARRLRKAAGPKVTLVGMTFYDPFLQSWFTNPALAQATVKIAKDQFNAELIKAYKASGFKSPTWPQRLAPTGRSHRPPPTTAAPACR